MNVLWMKSMIFQTGEVSEQMPTPRFDSKTRTSKIRFLWSAQLDSLEGSHQTPCPHSECIPEPGSFAQGASDALERIENYVRSYLTGVDDNIVAGTWMYNWRFTILVGRGRRHGGLRSR
jgi:hypothetical protein